MQLKNKDGVILKVGQVWWDSDGEELRIVGFYGTMPVVRNNVDGSFDTESPDDPHAFVILAESDNGANLEQARKDGWLIWVEGMEEPDMERIEAAELFEPEAARGWQDCHPVGQFGITYRYKLKAEEPQEPEHLELEILRGMPRNECVSMREKTVGVNTINPSFYMFDNAYNLIGYRYAESDVITCTGPNAWWYGANNRLAVPKSNGYTGNYIPHPVFATHAVYEKVKK